MANEEFNEYAEDNKEKAEKMLPEGIKIALEQSSEKHKEYFLFIKDIYERDKELGVYLMSMTIASTCIAITDSIDEAIGVVKRIDAGALKAIAVVDKAFNTGKMPDGKFPTGDDEK